MRLRSVTQALAGRGLFAMASIAIVAACFALGLSAGGPWESDALASTQQCNTTCQSKMTDCILSCDGVLPCELACKKKAVGCVNACSSDAGPLTTSYVDASIEGSEARIDGGRPRDAAREATGDDARRPRARDQ